MAEREDRTPRGAYPLHDFQSCLFSQLQHLSTFIYHIMACLSLWRRGWDLNPRDASAQRFSRPPHSATLSLSKFIFLPSSKEVPQQLHIHALLCCDNNFPTEWFKRSSCTRFISEETAPAFDPKHHTRAAISEN